MKLDVSVLHLPKAGSAVSEYEDSFYCPPESGIAAVSDGASNNFESRLWARLLTRAFVERPPIGWTRPQVLDWVDLVAADWSKSIPWQKLTVFEEEKAALGSAATLVGLQLSSSAVRSPRAVEGTWRCLAVGDSCLFQITGGHLVTKLPVEKSADFSNHPPLLSTRRENSELTIDQLRTESGTWRSGDTFYLLTDAIAAWFLLEFEQGGSPWKILSSLNRRSFVSFVHDRRARNLMRNDDVTVVTLRVPARSGARRPQPARASAGAFQRLVSHRAPSGPTLGTGRAPGEASRCL